MSVGVLRNVLERTVDVGHSVMQKTIDLNRYATKKTFSQGLLDIALLITNASQLKYVLQIVQGVICVFLGSSLNINKEQDQKKANKWNDICLSLMVITVAVNVVISVFEMRDIDAIVASAKNVN